MAFAKVKLLESTDVKVKEIHVDGGKGERDLEINVGVSSIYIL